MPDFTSKIYLDNASTTPIYPEVVQEMVRVMEMNYGNPSSTHSLGQESKSLIEQARKNSARYFNVLPQEIIFTSCGSESNNLIIRSCVSHLKVERIITTTLEHKSVLETCLDCKKNYPNLELVFLSVNSKGEIDLEELEDYLASSSKKTLVSLMHANNEIGNLLDLKEVGNLVKKYEALFHSDTVQTIAHLPLDLGNLPVDFATASAHKFHGPKGIGFAYIKKGNRLKSIFTGGGQERSIRSGTENIYGIVGMEKALELSMKNLDAYREHLQELKKYTIQQIQDKIPQAEFAGTGATMEKSLDTVLNVLLPFKNDLIGFQLDMQGICISQGSACSSGAAKPSTVLSSILSYEKQETITPIRISFSHLNTKQEIDTFISALRTYL